MPVQKGRKWSVDHTVICIHTTEQCIYTQMRRYHAGMNSVCVEWNLRLELSKDLAREKLDLIFYIKGLGEGASCFESSSKEKV